MNEYKSFFKSVEGNEGTKCHYSTRLDTYGCGCSHDCSYCYAKSLLEFRNLWRPEDPSIADISKVRKKIAHIKKDGGIKIVRLGGMTDCFQPIEKTYRVTYETIKALNEAGLSYLIVTKSSIIADDEYLDILDRDLAHVQITLTTTSDELYKEKQYEKASLPSERIRAIEKLYQNGIDVAVRLSPYIPEYVDLERLGNIHCDKIQVEFLRVNSWIKKWFDLDYSDYIVKQSNYSHLPLLKKIELVNAIKACAPNKEISVCDDESEAYEYWRNCFNPNTNDCCNLRRSEI